MKIGIIGSGDVAQSLGAGLAAAGHSVMISSRDPGKRELQAWKKRHKKVEVGNMTQAAAFADIAILAVAWHAADDVLTLIRPELAGKVVIDVTNPLVFNENDAPTLAVGHITSGGEVVQQSLPDSHVIKTLNFINHAHMAHPEYESGQPIMFVCGNNDSAKHQVRDVLLDLGWENMLNIGGIEKSRLLEPLAMMWIEYGVNRGTWDHAFAMLDES